MKDVPRSPTDTTHMAPCTHTQAHISVDGRCCIPTIGMYRMFRLSISHVVKSMKELVDPYGLAFHGLQSIPSVLVRICVTRSVEMWCLMYKG